MGKNKLELNRTLFWDVDYNKIDMDKRVRFVIERVVMYGFIEDWKAIKAHYGLETIKNEMLQTRYLDKKTLNFLSVYFEIPKEQFICYTYQQSIPTHWDY